MTKFFNILKMLPRIIVAIGFILFVIYNHRLNGKFTKLEVNSIIVKRDNWQLRTTEFYLQNGLRVDSNAIDNFDLKLGDSISKQDSTQSFDVYRKLNGKYKFFTTYIIQ
jgi:hypothetical protein